MGAYLSQPLTEKHSEDGEGNKVRFGASCMQGWRVSQEDAHNCVAEFDDKSSLFAVYDGHGGAEVAAFLALHFPEFLKNTEGYKNGDLKEALHECFVKIDEYVKSEKGLSEVQALSKKPAKEDGCTTVEENMSALYEEAAMPLEELVAKYKSTPMYAHLTGPVVEEDAKEKPGSSKSIQNSIPKMTEGGSGSSSSSIPAPESVQETKPTTTESSEPTGTSTPLESEMTDLDSKSLEAQTPTPKDPQITTDKIEEKAEEPESSKEKEKVEEPEPEPLKEKVEETESSKEKVEEPESSKEKTNGCDEESKIVQNGISKNSKETEESMDQEIKSENSVLTNGDAEAAASKREESILVENSPSPTKVRKGKSHPPIPVPVPVTSDRKLKVKDKKIYKEFVNAGESGTDSEDGEDETFVGTEKSDSDDSGESGTEGLENSEDTSEAEEGDESEDDDEDEDDEDDDEEVDLLSDVQEPGFDSGSTAVVAFLKWQIDTGLLDLWVANAGDSRCIISRGGKSFDMSQDHKPEDPIETRRIVTAGGKVTMDGRVNGGLNLSRAIGDHSYKQNAALPLEEQMITPVPDIQHALLDPSRDDFIVLACDGVWNSMTSEQVVDFVAQRLTNPQNTLSAICEQLFDHCLAGDTSGDGTGCDNMTAVIIKIGPNENECVKGNGKRVRTSPSPPPPEDCKKMKVDEGVTVAGTD